MKYVQEIKKLIDDISSKTINVKNYEKMTINEISERLREIVKFEQDVLNKIDEFEKAQKNIDLLKYTKIICANIIKQETAQIQKIYLKKISTVH